jgi:arylsulfatase A-like enzyme
MNVILMITDSLRADHAYNSELMPNLNEFARRHCIKFNRAYTTAPWTLAANASLLTSRYPTDIGVSDATRSVLDGVLMEHRKFFTPKLKKGWWLPSVLQEWGYYTMAKMGGGWVSGAFGFANGFHCVSQWDWVYLDVSVFAGIVLEGGMNDIRNQKTAWFFYSQDFDCHEPYGPWKRENSVRNEKIEGEKTSAVAFSESQRQDFVRTYYKDACSQYDKKLGRIFAFLEAGKFLENTAVVFLSDHGEELWEHQYGGHGYNLYEPVVRIPLLLHYPGVKSREDEGICSIVDVGATLLRVGYWGKGRNLLMHGSRNRAFMEMKRERKFHKRRRVSGPAPFIHTGKRGVVTNDYKYILSTAHGAKTDEWEELYCLRDDPEENNNLYIGPGVSPTSFYRDGMRNSIFREINWGEEIE